MSDPRASHVQSHAQFHAHAHAQLRGRLLTQAELEQIHFQREVLNLLLSQKPNTLCVRQRHRACIDQRARGEGVARRYSECRALVGAVVMELGVVREGGGTGEEGGQGVRRQRRERKRWLEGVEERVKQEGRFCASPEPVHARPRGRQEPFQERRRAGREHDGAVEYAAAADESHLHPGIIPPPVRGRLGEVPTLSRGRDGEGRPTRVRSRSTIASQRSTATMSTAGTDSVFNGWQYAVFGKYYFTRAVAVRNRASEKGKEPELPVSALVPLANGGLFSEDRTREERKRSMSADGRLDSASSPAASIKSRTTSGLPAEITAGFFSSSPEPPKEGKRWWDKVRWSKSPKQDQGKNEPGGDGPDGARRVGCAPGPSSRSPRALDHPLYPERSFCERCIPKGTPRGDGVWEETAPEKPGVERREYYTSPGRKGKPSPLLTAKDRVIASPLDSPEVLLSTSKPSSPPVRIGSTYSALPRTPAYGVVPPLAIQLQDVPDATAAANANRTSPIWETSEVVTLDRLIVDDEAIWIRCSSRLDEVSEKAAKRAWAKILRERAPIPSPVSTTTTSDNVKEKGDGEGKEPPSRSPSVKILATGKAEKVQVKRVRVQDLDCTSVAVPPGTTTAAPRAKTLAALEGRAAREVPEKPVSKRGLKIPWEGAWHHELPSAARARLERERLERAKTPGGYSVAESVAYSLSEALAVPPLPLLPLPVLLPEHLGVEMSRGPTPFPSPLPTTKDIREVRQREGPPPYSATNQVFSSRKEEWADGGRRASPRGISAPSSLPSIKQPVPSRPSYSSTLAILGTKEPLTRRGWPLQTTTSPTSSTRSRSASEEEEEEEEEQYATTDEMASPSTVSLGKLNEGSPGQRRKIVLVDEGKRVRSMEGILESDGLERGDSALGMGVIRGGKEGAP